MRVTARPSVATGWSAATAADRPGVNALRTQNVLGNPDLLLTAGAGRRTRATVGVPGARRELQAAGKTVTGADSPVATRLALRDGVPVHAVRLVNRRRGRGVRSRRCRNRRHRRVAVEARGGGRRRDLRGRRRRRNVGVEARRSRRGRRVNGRQDVRSRGRRGVRSRGRRGVRSRRRDKAHRGWRRGRIRSGPGRGKIRVNAHRVGVGSGGWHRHQRARDRGQDERLTDGLQNCSFRGARAPKANPRLWVWGAVVQVE